MPAPTLAELQKAPGWFWAYCLHCNHDRPIAVAPFVIRWGRTASSDLIRERLRCEACGHRGATLRHPSVGRDPGVKWQPFPVGFVSVEWVWPRG